MFTKLFSKASDFAATRRGNSAKLKTILLRINHECTKSPQAQEEAKKLCEQFLSQFNAVASVTVETADTDAEDAATTTYSRGTLEAMHYTAVDKIAISLGLTTEGNKSETIDLILGA